MSGGRVRSFIEDDIPQVASLHRRVFKVDRSVASGSYREYFTRVFLDNPAGEGPSLVYEGDDGQVLGFLGLVPRCLRIDGHRFHALVSSQFIVEPAGPGALVALRLVKAHLEGPQDLSIADEANDMSRRIWEGLGGKTALLLSIYWTRPLRPARLATVRLRQRGRFAPVAALARPLANVADALATRMPGSPFRLSEPPGGDGDEWGPGALGAAPDPDGAASLRVEYDDRTFQWLLDRARMKADGLLLRAALRKGQQSLGGYICHLDDEGVAEVLQLTATPSSVTDVLDHLFYDAWRQGAIAVTGRLEPRFMQALSDKHCLFHRRGPWVLVKTSRPQLLEAFQAGDVRFSRLDGEWSLRFSPRSERACSQVGRMS